MVVNDKGIIKRAEDVKLRADYQTVNITLDSYKLKKSLATVDGEETTDESLLGTVCKKVFVEDTKRELAVLVDFNEIGIKPTYGQGGKKLVKDDNNDMSTTKTVSTVYELGNIYAIDLADGSLYYINGEQIYTEEGSIVEVAENDTTVNKYEVETLNQAYVEARKFKTKWNVTLGEEVGSSTYSTVVLPVSTGMTYDAIIEWGDGTSTVIQHRVNGITLTADELKEKLTHNYTLAENDDGIREISISGTYSNFDMYNSTTTKLKLIGLVQWGNVNFKDLRFRECTNLAGSIPSPNIEECFANFVSFADCFDKCSNLTGEIPENLFANCKKLTNMSHTFADCSGLTNLSDNFTIPDSVTNMYGTFSNCSSLTSLPNNFTIPNSVTNMQRTFSGCSKLASLPANFTIPNSVTNMSNTFADCSGLTSLPDNFTIPDSVTNMEYTFFRCSSLASLPNNFTIPNSVTNINWTFFNCSSLTSLPDNFTIPNSVTNMSNTFFRCSSLASLPNNFTIPNSVTNMSNTFSECKSLASLPDNFTIPDSVTNMRYTFDYCEKLASLPANFTIPNSVTNMERTFYCCETLTSLPNNFTIPNSVTNTKDTFSNCRNLTGIMTIRANPTEYTECFYNTAIQSGGTLTVNYTSNCTNIDNIIATGNSAYVKKGSLVE